MNRVRGWRRSGVAVGVLGLALVSKSAPASGGYADYLAKNYGSVGWCTQCHTDDIGGDGTVTREFGKTLKARGLVGKENYASLDSAIAALGEADSDGDGATDFEELTLRGNPNDANVLIRGAEAPQPVEYGCVGGTIASRSDVDRRTAVIVAGFFALALLFTRRRPKA